jgi:5-methylcytosine-specific restriction endonuclease McrA
VSSPLKTADQLFSRYIRDRDGRCMGQGSGPACSGYLQCAHIISRRYRAIRWNEANAMALCQAHHTFWTHRPLEWQVWVFNHRGIDYPRLRWRALNDPPEKPLDAIARMRSAA